MVKQFWVLLLAGVFVSACGGSADNATPADEGSDAAGYEDASNEIADEEEGVFDPMVGTIDRAKEVEDMNMERKAETDAAIEANE